MIFSVGSFFRCVRFLDACEGHDGYPQATALIPGSLENILCVSFSTLFFQAMKGRFHFYVDTKAGARIIITMEYLFHYLK